MRRLLVLCLLFAALAAAKGPVYVLLWFDTEDYIEPAADDAALRLAQDLEKQNVRATFKVVGEKARTLEARGRWDVIAALCRHDIGYHANTHSQQPTPALYLRELDWAEGAVEFARREGPGVRDIRRIFGVIPSCYGQPGSSWGPQSYPALRQMGIPVYLDEATQVGVEGQPFWYGGMLNVFHMEPNLIRPSLDREAALDETLAKFDRSVATLAARGGGVISTYFHPTEFVTTEFWDVNFAKGANPERKDWRMPHRRTPEESERCYRILARYVEHARNTPGVRFVTAREIPMLYESALETRGINRNAIAAHMSARQSFLVTPEAALSAADMLLLLLGMELQVVDGPVARRESNYSATRIPRPAFDRAKADTISFIRAHRRLPSHVWIGAERLALPDFAATLAGDDQQSDSVAVRRGNPEMEQYVSREPAAAFRWLIHPDGFQAPELLEMARLQAWTLKPARLK
jgi:hypothetical protein